VESSGCDMRQIINVIQMWKNAKMDRSIVDRIGKDESVMIGNFDAAHRLLDHGKNSLDVRYPTFR
jgi:hypothetical protein